MNKFKVSIAIALFYSFLLVVFVALSLSFQVPLISFQNGDLQFIIQGNNDFLVFYGTVFLTCVVGMVTLLQLDTDRHGAMKVPLAALYFVLLGGVTLSVEGIMKILKENFTLIYMNSTQDLQDWFSKTTSFSFNQAIQGVWGMVLAVVLTLMFVGLFDYLFFAKIEVKKEQTFCVTYKSFNAQNF